MRLFVPGERVTDPSRGHGLVHKIIDHAAGHQKVKKEDSTLGKKVDLTTTSVEDALNLKVNSVYHLEPKDFDKDLKSKLDKGDVFSFPFNYYADFKLEDGILLKGEKDYFALIGRKTNCNWVGEHSEDLPEEVEEFEDNDLDFEMM